MRQYRCVRTTTSSPQSNADLETSYRMLLKLFDLNDFSKDLKYLDTWTTEKIYMVMTFVYLRITVTFFFTEKVKIC